MALDISITGFRVVHTNHDTPMTEISDRQNDIHKQIDKTAQSGLMAIDTSERDFALAFTDIDYPGGFGPQERYPQKIDNTAQTGLMAIDTSKTGSALAFSDLDYTGGKVSDRRKDIHKKS
ncbi:unnamed protein product [Heligmosomoides polygyrus]|uniref:Tnp_DDE_dom domain-containing protein n=1 Tax=Heligmosomoides polygyrus TaxID=6339 RepID=A0A183GQ06_HELPZ|nr:unnamed protein product [Heligmosomoides polygyrus]